MTQVSADRWVPDGICLITGVAGFIGSNLLQRLLLSGVPVTGLDNFSTGSRGNLAEVQRRVGDNWRLFRLVEGDIRASAARADALRGVNTVFHQAGLNSVPRSLDRPLEVAETNTLGSLGMLVSALSAGAGTFVYASSSSVYGDLPDPLRSEATVGRPMSPYAASKRAAELFADGLPALTAMKVVGLRYFNVYGPRQNASGSYSAVIPRWIRILLDGGAPEMYGDGLQSRDFTSVRDVVSANLLASTSAPEARPIVLNVGSGKATTIRQLYDVICGEVVRLKGNERMLRPVPSGLPSRLGDVRSAVASLVECERVLGYRPTVDLAEGIAEMVDWMDSSARTGTGNKSAASPH